MPTMETPQTGGGRAALPVRVGASLVTELVWAASVHPGEPEQGYPARLGRFAGAPGLEGRLSSFWDDGEPFFTEVLVLADRAGILLETDAERVFQGLADAAAGPARPEPLESESPDDRERFRARLSRLRRNRRLREAWLSLLREAWDAAGPGWEARGRMAVEAQARELRHKLPAGVGYADVQSMFQCQDDATILSVVRDTAAAGGEVVLVPSWFGRKGMFVSMPGRILLTPPTQALSPGPTPETRKRARRFKAMGDPTRLAILEAAARRPRTVGELAGLMGLAQPTVSNHVRVLREAGLLAEKERDRKLAPDLDSVRRLFDEAAGVIAG